MKYTIVDFKPIQQWHSGDAPLIPAMLLTGAIARNVVQALVEAFADTHESEPIEVSPEALFDAANDLFGSIFRALAQDEGKP